MDTETNSLNYKRNNK